MKHSVVFRLNGTVEELVELLQTEKYHVEEGKSRDIVVDTKFHVRSESENQLRFDVEFLEYKRTKLGGVDRSGTQTSWSRCTFDRVKNTMFWRYDGPESHRFSMSGTYSFEQIGGQIEVHHDVEMEVNIPLIGKRVSKMALSEFEKEMPRVQSEMQRMLREKS